MNAITIGAASDLGMRRKENQDHHAFYSPQTGSEYKKGLLMALADGMGGHSGGAIASKIAVDVLLEEYYNNSHDSIENALNKAFLMANQKVMDKAKEEPELEKMGTTLTTVVFKGDKMYYAHVGDSRGYIIEDNTIMQFTEDHSYVASLVKAGAISEEEALTHPEKNIITRAIGLDPNVKVDVAEHDQKLKKGQYILLCCDGLHGVVPNDEIVNTVYQYQEPQPICDRLVEQANEQGGPDNITVMVARIEKTGIISDITNRIMNLMR